MAVAPAVALLLALLGAAAAASDQQSRCGCVAAIVHCSPPMTVHHLGPQLNLARSLSLQAAAPGTGDLQQHHGGQVRRPEVPRQQDASCRPLAATCLRVAACSSRPLALASIHACRWYITDDKGMVCPRDSLDYATGCCTAGKLHSCKRCARRLRRHSHNRPPAQLGSAPFHALTHHRQPG